MILEELEAAEVWRKMSWHNRYGGIQMKCGAT